MKKFIIVFLFSACLNLQLFCQEDYFRFLPDDSLLKRECSKAENKKIWPFKSRAQKSCEHINTLLYQMEEIEKMDIKNGSLLNTICLMLTAGWVELEKESERVEHKRRSFKETQDGMKESIRIILSKESDKIKWKEFASITDPVLLDKVRKERWEQQQKIAKEKEEAREKNGPKF